MRHGGVKGNKEREEGKGMRNGWEENEEWGGGEE